MYVGYVLLVSNMLYGRDEPIILVKTVKELEENAVME